MKVFCTGGIVRTTDNGGKTSQSCKVMQRMSSCEGDLHVDSLDYAVTVMNNITIED